MQTSFSDFTLGAQQQIASRVALLPDRLANVHDYGSASIKFRFELFVRLLMVGLGYFLVHALSDQSILSMASHTHRPSWCYLVM